jgi:multiple sugar transport system permease protein
MIKKSDRGLAIFVYIVLTLFGLLALAPFIWMLFTSLKPLPEVEAGNLIPHAAQPRNYGDVFKQSPFAVFFLNSFLVAAWVTFLTVLVSAMAAFAFARLQWKGRDLVFKLYLATLMVPGVVTMIPNYAVVVQLKLLDSLAGLVIPAAFGAFGVFLLRQFMLTIPSSLDEAAEIDGADPWTTFWEVTMPLAKSGLTTLAIFTFLGNYSSFYWPLLIIKSEELRTLPIGMLFFDSIYGRQTNLLMAASVMSILPPLIVFILAQKQLVRGIMVGAVKG